MKNELNTLADMLAAYRNNERHFPTYDDLAGLLNAQPRVSCDPAENEHLARDAQAIVDADVKALGDGQVYLSAVAAAADAVPVAAAPQVVADERAHEIMNSMAVHVDGWADGLDYEPSKTEVSGKALHYILSRVAAPVQAQEPVAEVSAMPGTSGFTMAVFKADDMPIGSKVYRAPVQPVAVPDGELDSAMTDPDQVPYLIVFDDADRENEHVIGGTRARYRFKQISVSWNAHLFVKIASNSRDDKYPCAMLAAPAAQGDAKEQMGLLVKVLEKVRGYHVNHHVITEIDAAITAAKAAS